MKPHRRFSRGCTSRLCVHRQDMYMKAFDVNLHAWTWAVATHAGMDARRLYGPHAGIRTPVKTQLGAALANFTATAELCPALTHSPGSPGTQHGPGAQSAAGPCQGGSAGRGRAPGRGGGAARGRAGAAGARAGAAVAPL